MIRFYFSAIVAGVLFGVGLVVSGMTDPLRVIGFLNVLGAFDPTLVFVLGGAALVTIVAFRFVLRLRKPLYASDFVIPPSRAPDGKLIAGAAIFGVGWGLAGYCPGPAVAGLAIGSVEALWFVGAMLVGSGIYGWATRNAGQ